MAENVKALRKVLPVLEAEYRKAGYKCHAQLFNSKFWGVPQNRERYIVVGILDTLPDTYLYPEEQHDFVPKLSTILEKDVPENFYIDDDKARKIIDQALQRLEELKGCHATITPDRVDKRQNGRRAKENEAPMFTLTAQDLHGVILDPVLHIMEKQEKQNDLIPEGDNEASALIHSRGLETRKDGICHCLKGGTGGSSKNFLVEREREPEPFGNPKIMQVAHKGSGGQKGWIHHTDGIVGAVTATDYKDPKLILERTDTDK